MNIYVALLIGYSAALTGLGLWIARKVRGPADFFVAGRKLTWPYIAATMLAANIGAGATVAATGLAYQQGVSAWFWNGSAGLGSLVLATLVGPKIWALASERGYLTVGDFLEDRYGQSVRVIIASLIWFGALFILAGQLLLGAAVFSVVAGLPKWAGVLVGGAAMTGYFSAGGLLSSVGVSAVQLIVKFTGFAIAIPILLNAAGGLEAITATPGLPATFFDPLFSAGPGSGFTILLLTGPNFIVSPGLVQKIYGADGTRTVRMGVGANAIALLVFAFMPVFLGLTARVLLPGIEGRDLVLPTLLLHGLPVWLGALALAAVFSAEMGACEAILFMLSTSLSQDLYKRVVNPNATPGQVLGVARIAALIGGTAGMLLAIFVVGEIIDALSVFYAIIGATLLVPVVGGLFVRTATSREALTSIATGMIAFLAVRYGTDRTGWSNPNLWGLLASAAGFLASLALSRMTRRQLPAA
ncbi:MAG TPA: sodium:solute symporter family protein [Vicinamibacterales bacterium]|nr:sodium:solute symporter family protein [Vicinamibacterales bacterium]